MRLSIVMPVLNEAAGIEARLRALADLRARGTELIVVDGGSRDGSADRARALADQVIEAPRGRAAQCNAGADRARGDVLLFLHADTGLPTGADALIAQALAAGHDWGRFDVRIDGRHPGLPLVAWAMNRRSRLTGIATGDQAMFVRRALFQRLGGFAPLPLMEDIELSSRLRRIGRPACLSTTVSTAGRRWDSHGFCRTVGLMWWLRAAYACGAEPAVLAQRYGYTARPGAAVAVMAKAPVPGLAKTRLVPLLGEVGAARAQRALLRHTLRTVRAASIGPLRLWCAPDTHHRCFRALARTLGIALAPQALGDLGQRMAVAMQAHFRASRQPWIVIGTDAPALTPAHLQAAADALQTADAVMVPAEDGGYVLLGLRRPVPTVFEAVPWSTDQVAAITRERLRAVGASLHELPALWDVDEPADWQRWQRALSENAANPSGCATPS